MSYKIKSIALTSLNQGKLGEFHKAAYELAAKTAFKDSASAVCASYETLCATYADLVKGNYASGYTAMMVRLDAARDNLFAVVRSCLGYMSKSQDAAVLTYYTEKVVPLLNLYKGSISAESYSEETLHIRAFLNDLKTLDKEKLGTGYVTEAMMTELETLNDNFEAAYVNRTQERSQTSTDEIRQMGLALNDLYALVCAHAVVLANTEVTEQNSTAVAAARAFIAALNEHIDYQYRYYIGSSTGGTEDEGGETGEGGTEGSEGSDNGSSSSSGSSGSNGSNGSSGSNGSNGSSQSSGAGGASSGGDNGGGSSYVL